MPAKKKSPAKRVAKSSVIKEAPIVVEPIINPTPVITPTPPVPPIPPTPPTPVSVSPPPPVSPAVQGPPAVPESNLDAPLAIDSINETDEESKLDQRNKVLFALGTGIAVTIILASLAVSFIYQNHPPVEKKITPPALPSVTATPTPMFERRSVTLEILNGSGKAGQAGKVAGVLGGVGYTVVKTGNAPKDIKKSQLFTASTLTPFQTQELITDATAYGISSVSGTLTDSTAAARLIIGSE